MRQSTVFVVGTLAAALSVCASDLPLMVSQGSDTAGQTFWSKTADWACEDGVTAAVAPSDSRASQYDYLLKNGLRTPSGGALNVFYCHKLTVRANVPECSGATTVNEFRNEGVVLESGSFEAWPDRNGTCTYRGKFTVASSESSPFSMKAGSGSSSLAYSTHCFRLEGTLLGTDDSVALKIGGAAKAGSRFVLASDAADYKGTIYCNEQPLGAVFFSSVQVGGKVVGLGSRIGVEKASDIAQLNDFSWGSSTEFILPVDSETQQAGCLVVNGIYEQEGVVHVRYVGRCFSGAEVPILKLGPDAVGAIDAAKFVLDGAAAARDFALQDDALANWPWDVVLKVSDDGKTLSLASSSSRILVSQTEADPDDAKVHALTNGTAWSDGEAPHAGADYLTKLRLNTGKTGDYVFPAENLFLQNAGTSSDFAANQLTQNSSSLTVSNLYLYPASVIAVNGNSPSTPVLKGNLTAYSSAAGDSVYVDVIGGKTYRIESELSGNGHMVISEHGRLQTWGSVALPNENPNFKGTWKLSLKNNTYAGNEAPRDDRCKKLIIGTGLSLGGALDAFDYKALEMDQMSVLQPTASLDLNEPTRGIAIGNLGRMDVPDGLTMTVMSPLTIDGQLRKEGAGTLVLGGDLHFLSAEKQLSEMPRAGSNLLTVATGTLKVASTNALDGLSVRIASDASFAFDVQPTDEGVKNFGIVNVKNEEDPFVALGERIAVRLDGVESQTSVIKIAIATVKNVELADALTSKLQFVTARRRIITPKVRTNADGTASVVVSISVPGLLLTVQ